MDKNIIKNLLTDRFLNEARGETATPGISVTKDVQKKSEKINKAGVKDIEKDVKDFDKKMNKSKSEPVKFNYNNKKEKDYHDQMEIMNGQEMIQFDRDPNKEFKDRAKQGIEGSSIMGNKAGKDTANVEPAWGASSDTFGKDLVKKIKASTKKRFDADDRLISFGDDIETVPKGQKPMAKHSALSENKERYYPPNAGDENDFFNELGHEKPKEKIKEEGTTIKPEKVGSFTAFCKGKGFEGANSACEKEAMKDKYPASIHKKATFSDNVDEQKDNTNNKKPQIKESMKRLTFKNSFNGVGNALKMIPESYRTDNKTFEMTDGNESYRIRWEGTLSEGRAVVLTASDKTMVNEDMAHMKHLMGYKSQDTLGTVKGNARLDENAIFNDIMNKSKMLLEGDEGMNLGVKAKKGEWDKVSKKAPEATKHIEGSTSDDKGTQAPKAKTSTGEALDSAKKQAPEAKKHVQGGLATGTSEIGMGLGETAPEGEWENISVPQAAPHGNPSKTTYNPKPSTGEWEKISVPHASDAKKHISMKEGLELGGITFKPIKFVIENTDLKKKVNEDDNENAENKFKKKIARGEKTQADYDEWIKNKGKFTGESVEEEGDGMIDEHTFPDNAETGRSELPRKRVGSDRSDRTLSPDDVEKFKTVLDKNKGKFTDENVEEGDDMIDEEEETRADRIKRKMQGVVDKQKSSPDSPPVGKLGNDNSPRSEIGKRVGR